MKTLQTKHLQWLMSTRPLYSHGPTGSTSFSGHGRQRPVGGEGGGGWRGWRGGLLELVAMHGPADSAVSVKRDDLCIYSWLRSKEI